MSKYALTKFIPLVSFYKPLKTLKNFPFSVGIEKGGTEKDQCYEMD